MSTIRGYVIPAFVLLGLLALFATWDFGEPRRFHGMAIPFGTTALKPEASLPVWHEVRPGYSDDTWKYDKSEPVNEGVPPWNTREDMNKKLRDSNRKSTQRVLDQAWSTFCTPAGRVKLAGALDSYFGRRQQEEQQYAQRWGKEGADYITREWQTADDLRIERLVEETYERGYLDLHDLRPTVAQRLAPLLKDSRVSGQPCKP